MFPEAIVDALTEALAAAARGGELPELDVAIEVERPRDRSHGDWASNVALVAAGRAGKPPRQVADIVLRHLPEVAHLESVDLAGPGFLNFRLARSWLGEVLRRAATGPDFGRVEAGAGSRVQVEFVSVNPNGPLHIGHGRGGMLGDALSNLLDFAGFEVSREYYINDAGVQMDLYAASLEARYLQALGQEAVVPEDGYHGEYLAGWAGELAGERGESLLALEPAARRAELRAWGIARALSDIRETLDLASIRFDVWFSEATLYGSGEVDQALALLRERGYAYDAEGAVWFKASAFGDDKDRVLVKSDGTFTYMMPDIAYHWDKYRRGFDLLIDIWGSDHHGYVPRLRAAVEAMGRDPATFEVIITQLVTVTRGGEPVRMSTRAGEGVSFREVLEEVGADATRYHLLAFSPDTALTFDIDVVKRQSMDNPVYYLQYAHARMRSLERFAAQQGVDRGEVDTVDIALLAHPAEVELLHEIDRLPGEVEIAALRRAPHRICAYGYELATAFHKFYTDCRVVADDVPPELSRARLWLVEAAKNALLAVLGILGISAPEEM